MFAVKRSQVDVVEAGRFVSNASDIGFRVGEWPSELEMVDTDGTRYVFKRDHAMWSGEDFAGYRFFTRDGMTLLTIYND